MGAGRLWRFCAPLDNHTLGLSLLFRMTFNIFLLLSAAGTCDGGVANVSTFLIVERSMLSAGEGDKILGMRLKWSERLKINGQLCPLSLFGIP